MTIKQKRIGILGTGDVGQALGTGFLSLGCEVKMGSREANNEKAKGWAEKQGAKASFGTFTEAAQFGEILVLATLGSATIHAIELAGVSHFDGKVVMDTTNPLTFSNDQPPQLFVGHTDSLGEQVQRKLPLAHVVKAFNTVGNAHMVHPQFKDGPPDMFLGGNDADAKKVISELCQEFGWNSMDLGGIQTARLLEPMCLVWVYCAIRMGSWNHAFKLLKK